MFFLLGDDVKCVWLLVLMYFRFYDFAFPPASDRVDQPERVGVH